MCSTWNLEATGPRILKPARGVSLLSKILVIREVLSDDRISTKDSIASSMKYAKYNLDANENKLLIFCIKQLKQWTSTLTIALRHGAPIKGLNE